MDKNKGKVKLSVVTRQSVLFDGEVETVSSVNDNGEFDVLEKHTNFISLVKDKIVIYTFEGEKQEMKIKEGLMRVVKDEVKVFLGLGH
jgi:F0F1-type ATP synthase epsilon subunit